MRYSASPNCALSLSVKLCQRDGADWYYSITKISSLSSSLILQVHWILSIFHTSIECIVFTLSVKHFEHLHCPRLPLFIVHTGWGEYAFCMNHILIISHGTSSCQLYRLAANGLEDEVCQRLLAAENVEDDRVQPEDQQQYETFLPSSLPLLHPLHTAAPIPATHAIYTCDPMELTKTASRLKRFRLVLLITLGFILHTIRIW